MAPAGSVVTKRWHPLPWSVVVAIAGVHVHIHDVAGMASLHRAVLQASGVVEWFL